MKDTWFIVLNCMLQMGQVDKLVEVNSIDHQDLGLQGREVKMFFKSVYTAFPDFHTTTIDRMDMENAFSIYKNENYV